MRSAQPLAKGAACEAARDALNGMRNEVGVERGPDDLQAGRERARVKLQAIADRADVEGAAALRPWIDALSSSSATDEQQRQIQRTVESCGWRYDSYRDAYVPAGSADDALDPGAPVVAFIQDACSARAEAQQQPNDGTHLRSLVPYLRTVEQKAARGLEAHPDSDDLTTLRDWARKLAELSDHDEVEMPSGVEEDELIFDLSQRVGSVCDRVR